jgi:hypothetical protein
VRPTRADVFSSVQVNYKLVLNVIALGVFVALFALTLRRGERGDAHGAAAHTPHAA